MQANVVLTGMIFKQKMVWGILGICVVVGIVLLIPTSYDRILVPGTDTYSAHRPVYGDKKITQEITFSGNNLAGVGVIAVDLKRSNALSPLTVTVISNNAAVSHIQGTIDPKDIQDDTFAYAVFPKPLHLENKTVVIEITAPHATPAQPIGLRFDQDSNTLALAMREQVPAWKQAVLWIQTHPALARHVATIILGGLTLTFFLISTQVAARYVSRKIVLIIALSSIVVFAAVSRIPTLLAVESAFGGDAFNYFFKANAWMIGADPFAADVRKGPLFPLMVIPGLVMPDPLLWGKSINVVASLVAIALVPLILIRLSLSMSIALGGGMLLAVNRNFWWESVHSASNLPYAALIVLLVFIFLFSHKKRIAYLMGVVSGLIVLMRYEGAAVVSVIMPAVWLLWRRFSIIAYTLIPLGILLAFPFILWPLTGNIGVRPPSDLTGDPGLNIVWSWGDFWLNAKEFKKFFGSNWILMEHTGNQWYAVIVGAVIGAMWVVVQRYFPRLVRIVSNIVPFLLIAVILGIVIRDATELQKYIVVILSGLTGLGAAYLGLKNPRFGIPVLLMIILQGIIVTAILPKPRYYVHLIPFMAMGLTIGIYVLGLGKSRLSKVGTVLALSIIVMMAYLDSQRVMPDIIEDYNIKSQTTTVMLNAARFLRPETGTVALATDDLPMRLYVTDPRLHVFPVQTISHEDEEAVYTWLQSKHPDFVVESTENPLFVDVLKSKSDHFEKVYTGTTSFGKHRATVYRFKQ